MYKDPANRPNPKGVASIGDSEEFTLPKSPPIPPPPGSLSNTRSTLQPEQAEAPADSQILLFPNETMGFKPHDPHTWYRAAESGNDLAMACLGDSLCWGGYIPRGIPRDVPKGVELLERSSAHGHPLGIYLFSRTQRILAGYRQHPDIADATEKRALEAGFLKVNNFNCPVWMIAEAVALREGGISPVDLSRQFELIEQCSETDYTDAWTLYGFCLFGGEGVSPNSREGFEWLRRSAENLNGTALTYLGNCYRNGTGVKKDPTAAIHWYRAAAANGQDEALNSLGYCARHGIGCKRNAEEAVRFYRSAAETRHPSGCFNMGFSCEKGLGTRRDRNEAIEWYRKAAALGHTKAAEALRRLAAD
jgi:TPR repeat protein